MRTRRPLEDPDSAKSAYALALRWLSGRELTRGQVAERLERRGYSRATARAVVAQLAADRAVDDRRAAIAVARMEASVRRRGPRRVMMKLIAMHVERDLADEVVRDLFEDEGESDLLEQALEKRLRGNLARLGDPLERRKLVAQLVRQGFSPSAALSLIRRKSRAK